MAQQKQRVIWLYYMPGSMSATQQRPMPHSDGRYPVFTSEETAHRYMIARWRVWDPLQKGKTWCSGWTSGKTIKMSWNTPFHEWREMRLTKNHVVDPIWQPEED